MHILNASFIKSATRLSEWPQPESAGTQPWTAEIALCGRSNVGKSTLLNAMLQRKSLARVSRTPGRTRLINFFAVQLAPEGQPRLTLSVADLPGFGYAQVSKAERVLWRHMMEEYLTRRDPLKAIVLLCDSRRALEKDAAELLYEEIEIGRFLRAHGRAVIPVLTKSDKLAKHERKPAAQRVEQLIGQRVAICSGLDGEGVPALWRRLIGEVLPMTQAEDHAGAEGLR